MRFRVVVGALMASLAALSGQAAGAAPAVQAPPPVISAAPLSVQQPVIPADPAVRRGVLPNGLHYALMHTDQAKGAVSVRLAINVGSYEEHDNERGVAHFIEHMAFRSTKAFPDNTVDGAFAPDGVSFGRDQNAFTSLFWTRFQLDMPRVSDPELARAFLWLRNVADGVVFDPAAVDKERGVVLAEKEARGGEETDVANALTRFHDGPMRAAQRDTIGDDATLHAVTGLRLEAFYRRWYRPDDAFVVITGDMPLDDMERLVQSSFGSWASSGAPPPRAALSTPDAGRGLDVFTLAAASLPTNLSVCRMAPPDPPAPQDLANLRREVERNLWREIVNERLRVLQANPANHILNADLEDGPDKDHRLTCLSVYPSGDAWPAALAATGGEVLRFGRAGPTEAELERALEVMRAGLRGSISTSANRTPDALADTLLDSLLDGAAVIEPRQSLRDFDLAVEYLTPADLKDAFNREAPGADALISVTAPSAPSTQEVRAAWDGVVKGPAQDYDEGERPKWAYVFAPAGQVASTQLIEPGHFTRVRFRNGVILNFKHTDFARDEVTVVLQFGQGRREIADSDYMAATVGAEMLSAGGVGKHSFAEIGRIFPLGAQSFDLTVGEDAFLIAANDPPSNLLARLNVLAAYMSDPAFGPGLNPFLHEAAVDTWRSVTSSAQQTAYNAMMGAVEPGGPLVLPPQAAMEATDNARIAAILKGPMTGGTIDITLVGDLDEADAIKAVADTFGALPARAPYDHRRKDITYLRFAQTPPGPIHALHHGPPDKAYAEVVWPLYVATPARRREEHAIQILAAIFNDRLRRRVRSELGQTYAPSVDAVLPDFSDQGQLSAAVESHPGDLDSVVAEIRSVAARLAAGDITPEQFEAARQPILADARRRLISNDWWASGLAGSEVDDTRLHDVAQYLDAMEAIQLDEVKKAAADWLSHDPVIVTATPLPRTPASSAAAAPASSPGARP